MLRYIIFNILFLIISSIYAQQEYNLISITKNNGVFTKIGETEPVEGNVFKIIKDKKINLGKLVKGRKHGSWIEWYPEHRRLEENYKNGILDGPVSLFFKNGQKEWRHNYTKGTLNGNYTRWYKNGQKASDGYFENGYEVGVWFWWNENGKLVKKRKFKKKEGLITGHKQYIDKTDLFKQK